MAATDDKPPTQAVGHTVAEISEKVSVLVREELELAQAEVSRKVSRLAKGAAVAAVAGVFAVTGLLFLLHTAAWGIWELLGTDGVWAGYAIVTGALFLVAIVAGIIGLRWIKRGSPPTPEMAIDEAKRIKETVTSS